MDKDTVIATLLSDSGLRDKLDDKIADNEEQRGRELAELLTRLGPTFIKVGQSLSIRTDLLSPGFWINAQDEIEGGGEIRRFVTKIGINTAVQKRWQRSRFFTL